MLFSVGLETWYAVEFFHQVEGKTTGDDGVWFADAEDPRYRRVNRVTSVCNVPLYAALVMLLLAMWGWMI